MKFVRQISLGDRLFNIEEDGALLLMKYFDALRQRKSSTTECSLECERQIAEYFWEWRAKENLAVRLEDVQRAITLLDNTGAYFSQASQESNNSFTESPNRFYRDLSDRKIGGVCSGLGHYLNVDPLIIRLIFGIGFLFIGLTFWIYLIIWIVTPAKTFSLNH
ncbi:MAG: PspC domain-containing protein [Bacteroides sp.]